MNTPNADQMVVPYIQCCMADRLNCEHAAELSLMVLDMQQIGGVMQTGKMPAHSTVWHVPICQAREPHECKEAKYRNMYSLSIERKAAE